MINSVDHRKFNTPRQFSNLLELVCIYNGKLIWFIQYFHYDWVDHSSKVHWKVYGIGVYNFMCILSCVDRGAEHWTCSPNVLLANLIWSKGSSSGQSHPLTFCNHMQQWVFNEEIFMHLSIFSSSLFVDKKLLWCIF